MSALSSLSMFLSGDNIFLLANGLIFSALLWLLFIRKTGTMAAFLFIILPVARGGPLLDINIGFAKLLLTAVLFMAVKYVKQKIIINPDYHRVGFLLVLLSLMSVTALLLSDDKALSFYYVSFLFTSILAFFIFCSVFDRTFLRKSLSMLLLCTYAACWLGILQYIVVKFRLSNPILSALVPYEIKLYPIELAKNFGFDAIRLPSFFFHSNGFGHFLSVVFGLHFAMLLVAKKRREQILYFTSVLSVLVACLLTLSRGSALVIAAEGLVILLLFRKEFNRTKLRVAAIGICFLLVGNLALSPNLYSFLERIQSAGLTSRDINWEYAVRLLPRYFILGAGPGMCSYHMLTSYPFSGEYLGRMLIDLSISGNINWYISHAHNFYLNTLIETGIFSLLVYGILFWIIIKKGFKIYARHHHALIRALVAGCLVPLGGCLVRGIFESYVFFYSSYGGFIVSFYFAIILYLDGFLGRKSAERTPAK